MPNLMRPSIHIVALSGQAYAVALVIDHVKGYSLDSSGKLAIRSPQI